MIEEEALQSLVQTLEQIRQLLPSSKAQWDGSPYIRLAGGGPWMEAGNAAEEFRRVRERSQECSRGPALWPIATGSPMLRRTISRRIGSGRNQS